MSKHLATPASSGNDDARRSTELPTLPKHREKDFRPRGYRAVGTIDLPGLPSVNVIDVADLDEAAEAFGSLRLLADVMADGASRGVAEMASSLAGFWAQRMRVLAAGAMALALVVGLGALSVGFSPAASAATAGKTWSSASAVPAIESPEPDPVPHPPVKHRTAFAKGAWFNQGGGVLFVAAPLNEFVPSCGWVPSPWSPVQVQVLRKGRWVVARTLVTRSSGYASGMVRLGGGLHTVRVVHPGSLWTLRTVGTTRRVVVTTEPMDID
jgi:hypothetical protein